MDRISECLVSGLRMVAAALFVTCMMGPTLSMASDMLEVGRRIYEEGVLSSGEPLVGVRFDNAKVIGAKAACVTCHRPSGMGGVEGDFMVPPVNGTYLLNLSQKGRANMDLHVGKLTNQYHPPYTDESLAETIRTGTNNNGHTMNVVMAHYDLPEKDMSALVGYLKQLSTQWSPGVTDQRISFATIVTPDVSAERRKVFLDMMRIGFTQHNGSSLQGKHHMVSAAEMLLRTERKWDLEVWELQGEPNTWGAQLDAFYRRQPVFAVISGLGGGTWEPVHDFCESQRVPCWFPSVDLASAKQGIYSIYFTRGVALEADVFANHLRSGDAKTVRRVIQVFRDDAVGRGAAQALKTALHTSGIAVEDRMLAAAEPVDKLLSKLSSEAGASDALMFWLQPSDVAELSKVKPPVGPQVFFSAGLSNGEHGFPAAWKPVTHLIYPFEMPEIRELNLAYTHAWLKSRKIPVVDEAMQSEVYFALTFLTDSISDMLDNLYRDYLLERAENMIGKRESSRAEEEARDRINLGYRGRYAGNRPSGADVPADQGPAPAPLAVGHSNSTTIYPRLSLGPGQRYASRGAYIVRFEKPEGDRLIAESDWIVP